MSHVPALLRAAHLEPAVGVTAITVLLCLGAGVGARTWLVAGAVLAGQLSIGWGNDWQDARADAAAGRGDKPVATGALSVAAVRNAAFGALGLSVVLSATLGLRPAALHLAGVGLGWAYNLGLKRSLLSGVCYAAAFALVPVFVGSLVGTRPPWWLVAAAACLGLAGHLVQTLGDEEADASTGVHGLPQRLGRRGSLRLAAAALAAAAILIAAGPGTRPPPLGIVLLSATILASAAAVLAGQRGRDRAALRLALLAAATATGAVLTAGAL